MTTGIRLRLSLFSILITLLVVSAITSHSLYFGRINKMEVHLSNSLNIHTVLAKGLANNLYFLDIKTLKNKLQYVLFNPLVDCVLVTGLDGNTLAPIAREHASPCQLFDYESIVNDPLPHPQVVNVEGVNYIQSSITMPDGEVVGYLTMGFPLSELERVIWDDLMAFLKLACIALLVGVFLAAMLSKRFSRPIRNMAQIADRIGQGQLDARVMAGRDDEIGALGRAINRMADNLDRITVSREYLDKVIHSMNEMVIVLNPDMRIGFVNKLTMSRLQYEKEELLTCSIDKVIYSQDDRSVQLFDALSQRGGIACTEIVFKSKSGQKIPVLFSASIIRQADDKLQGVVCVGLDITERKLAEEKIKQANEELLATNQQLQATQAQLLQSAKLASIGEMAAGLAHEINQPLGAICMNAEIIDTLIIEDRELPKEQARKALRKILAQIERISKIVKHLRVFSRDHSTLERELADINWIIEESLVLVSDSMKLTGIRVDVELAEKLPKFLCNYIQLEQVITNLISNAKDAVLEANHKVIRVRSYRDEHNLYVDVEDTGCGIPEAVIDRIFDPFFTTKEVGKGTGLGMSISYGIAKEHDGSIRVRSKVGEGSCFTLSLPIQSSGV